MLMTVTCPCCGQKCRVPESALGQAVQCPVCANCFQCGSLSPRSLTTKPILPLASPRAVDTVPQARDAQPQLGERIHYRCARCGMSLESAAEMAGQKLNCPNCTQRLQIPSVPPPAPVHALPISPAPGLPAAPVTSTSMPAKPTKRKLVRKAKAVAAPPPVERRENCLECGLDVTERKRAQECPDCGSVFCSARCYRDHRHHAHPSRG